MFRPILRAFTRALTRAFTGAFTSAFTSAFTRVSEDGRAPRCAARCATSSATRVPLAWLLLPLLAALPASGGAADLRAGVHPLLRRALTVPSEGIPVALRSQDAPSSIVPSVAGDREKIHAWVRTSDGGLSLQTAGLLPAGRPAAVRGARWTIEQLARAVQDPTVVRVTPSVRCIPSLDLSLPDVDAPHVHDGPPPNWRGLTGKNVLVGIVDTGIDLHHSDFLRTDGKTRVLALWDQTATGSSDPPRGFDYGKEWTAEQIDAGIVNSFDEVGHGTHVAGIAAGNGAATGNGQAPYRYVGMAPEATIAVVKTDFWDQSIADGVAYVFQKADSLGIPAVVNLSLGTQFGPHDGSDDFSYNLLLAGVGGAGHLLVAAAGNENGDGIHASRSLEPGATSAMTFHIPPYTPQNGNSNDEVDLDGWYDASAGLSLEMVSPGGHHVGPVARGDETAVDTPDGRVEISNGVFDPSNGDENFSIRIVDQIVNMPPREGTWQIRLQSSDPDTVRIDVWNWYYSMSGPVRFVDGLDESMTVGSPATADSAIGVGAYTTKASWVDVDGITRLYDPPPQIGEIAYFSSIGPRRDGVVKPEVAAPGRGVASALSEVARYANPSITNSAITEDGVHVVFQGTSMASPHVAGLCALMMQTFGPLTIRDALARLTASARSDPFTGIVPNPTWGWGKIDAFQATAYYTPVVVIEAAAAQNGDRVEVRFLLTEDVAAGALEVWREDPGAPRHPVGMSGSEGERRFVDSTLVEEGTYRYWLRVPQSDGAGDLWLGPAAVTFRASRLCRMTISPNPFLSETRIAWRAPVPGAVVSIHDPSGRRVRVFEVGAAQRSGTRVWDGKDDSGHPVAAGIYFVTLQAPGAEESVRKLIRIR